MKSNDSNPKPGMTSLLIGAWGFDVDAWTPSFYPEELPADWRFAYYSNGLRALLLPAETLANVERTQVAEWIEDCDSEFRFIPELDETAIAQALAGESAPLAAQHEKLAPLAERIAGWLLPVAGLCGATDDAVRQVLAALDDLPVCARGEAVPANGATRLASLGVGLVWNPAQSPEPLPGGRLLVVRTDVSTPAAQRAVLERAAAWQLAHGQAAVFFDHPAKAQQARVLAELMNL